MTEHSKGLLLTIFGVLLVTPDSLFVRLIDGDPLVTAFWRSLVAGLIVLTIILLVQGLNGIRAVLKTGWIGVFYAVMIATTAPAFVLAVSNTSVANVVFIFASMPVFAALFSWIAMKETVDLRMVLTMTAVIFGLGIIAYGSGTSEIASWKGDIWALYVSAAYAAAITAVRRVKVASMVPAIPFAYLGAAAVIWFFVDPFPAFSENYPFYVGHGAFLGAGSCLLALGPRFIRSAEAAVLILLESVLAPILVWMVIGEDPGPWALLGGAVVIGALLVSNIFALMRSRQNALIAG